MDEELTAKQVAKMSGASQGTVTWWARSGKLKGKLIDKPVSQGGQQYRFKKIDVLRFLKKQKKRYEDLIKELEIKVETIDKTLTLL